MVNAPQHQLAKWLAEMLEPAVRRYSVNTLSDSYEICGQVEEYGDQYPDTVNVSCMCSFDVASSFRNVPLDETTDIAIKTLFHDETNIKAKIPDLFRKSSNERLRGCGISIHSTMYKQTAGVAMGSPSRTGFGEYVYGIL